MILRPSQIYQLRIGRQVTPANFGGDSKSDSSTSTVNDTTNNAASFDRRAVASDEAIAITGDGSSLDRSIRHIDSSNRSTNFADSSNRSTTTVDSSNQSVNFMDSSDRSSFTSSIDGSNRSTNFADSSNRSTSTITEFLDSRSSTTNSTSNFADSSNRSTSFSDSSNRSVVNNVTDFGSIGKALDGMGAMGTRALDMSGGTINGALSLLMKQADTSQRSIESAFDFAKGAGANALTNSAQVLGFTQSTVNRTSDAFAESKDGGNSKVMMYAIGGIALVGAMYAMNK